MQNLPKLFVAIDGPDTDAVLALADRVCLAGDLAGGLAFGLKFNADFFLAQRDAEIVSQLTASYHRPIIAGLNLAQGGRTMANAVSALAGVVDFITVHAASGPEVGAAVAAVEGTATRILALTVSSHLDEEECERQYGCDVATATRRLAEAAVRHGCHGVVAPPAALAAIRDLDALKFCAGIRPSWYGDDGRHGAAAEPAEAVRAGADALIVGRPITEAEDVGAALLATLAEAGRAAVPALPVPALARAGSTHALRRGRRPRARK